MFKIIPREYIHFPEGGVKKFFKYFMENKLIEGNDIVDFERKFAEYIKVRYAIAVPKARVGLYLILKALKIKNGDEIILSSYNYPPISSIIEMVGVRPIFVDVNPDTYDIDPELIEQKITSRTKVIMVTHIEGLPCELNSILRIAKKHKIKIIEDCAHSLDAEHEGGKVGSFGDAAIFSLGSGKHLHTIDGGMVVTNNKKLSGLIRSELSYIKQPTPFGISKKFISSFIIANLKNSYLFNLVINPLILARSVIGIQSSTNSENEINFSKFFRYTNFQAAIGVEQLKLIEGRIRKRIENARILDRYLNKQVKRQKKSKNVRHTYLNYCIELQNRKAIREKLLLNGIITQNTKMVSCQSNFPVSKELEKKILYLPLHENLDRASFIFMARTLNKLLKRG